MSCYEFSRPQSPIHHNYYFNGTILDRIFFHNDIGIHYTPSLYFVRHINVYLILDGIIYEMFVGIEYLNEIGALTQDDMNKICEIDMLEANNDQGLYFNAFKFFIL